MKLYAWPKIRLYKYTTYRKELFKDLLFRFTPPSKLNDPFEGQADKQAEIDRISKSVWKDEEKRKDFLNALINRDAWNDDIGVFCLSESKHSLIMWSHYADNHRGIIIEFSGLCSLINHIQDIVSIIIDDYQGTFP